ncbi:MAG: hypothetical protein D6741_20740 [Planctomycetota bacterium]|nr:MAG: hypothetical protein D6741_20740 [Planctomycetota bacterium]
MQTSEKGKTKKHAANISTEEITCYEELKPGDRIVVEQRVTVGNRYWIKETAGTVVRTERVKRSLHHDRASDDPVYSDTILLEYPDGELTTITVDEYTVIRRA